MPGQGTIDSTLGADGERRKFAADRSNQDASTYQNYFSSTINSLIVLNGGASVAFLAFYGNMFENVSGWFRAMFILGEFSYFVGALLALIAIRGFHDAVQIWSWIWEDVAYLTITFAEARKKRNAERAILLGDRARRLVFYSLLCFIVATVVIGIGLVFFTAAPTSSTPDPRAEFRQLDHPQGSS
jgi:amino acid transporter